MRTGGGTLQGSVLHKTAPIAADQKIDKGVTHIAVAIEINDEHKLNPAFD
jgi:hypothetical protein